MRSTCIPRFLLLGVLAPAIPAAVIGDPDFFNANWSATTVTAAGASASSQSATRISNGGLFNSPYRRELHSVTSDNATYTALGVFHRMDLFHFYFPTAITSLDYSWNVRLENGTTSSVAYLPALEQNGVVYHVIPPAQGATTSNWTPNSYAGLTASSFCRAMPGFTTGTDTFDCGQNPVFAVGSPIVHVGYLVRNSFGGTINDTRSYASGIDEFVVRSVGGETPEPGTWALMAAGSALALGSGARQRRARSRARRQ